MGESQDMTLVKRKRETTLYRNWEVKFKLQYICCR